LGLGTQGKMERYMESNGDELREIKASLNWVTAKLQVKEGATHGEKSILSSYAGDDKEVWKLFRRELIQDGFSSTVLSMHKKTIKKYVMELGERGVLDEVVSNEVEMDLEDVEPNAEPNLEDTTKATILEKDQRAPNSTLPEVQETVDRAIKPKDDINSGDDTSDNVSEHGGNLSNETEEESTASDEEAALSRPNAIPASTTLRSETSAKEAKKLKDSNSSKGKMSSTEEKEVRLFLTCTLQVLSPVLKILLHILAQPSSTSTCKTDFYIV